MQNVFLSLLLIASMFSCSVKGAENVLKNGYYLGKIRKTIFEYYILIEIRDSTAIMNTFCSQKGVNSGYDVFYGIQNFPNLPKPESFRLPKSESFQFYRSGQEYVFYNSVNKFIANLDKGKLKILTPFEIALKYYDIDPTNLYPPKIITLYECILRDPDVLFESEEKPNESCISYIVDRLYHDFRYLYINNNDQMDYDEFYELLKSKVHQYKREYDNKPRC